MQRAFAVLNRLLFFYTIIFGVYVVNFKNKFLIEEEQYKKILVQIRNVQKDVFDLQIAWAHLNDLKRMSAIARVLSLEPIPVERIIKITDIPLINYAKHTSKR